MGVDGGGVDLWEWGAVASLEEQVEGGKGGEKPKGFDGFNFITKEYYVHDNGMLWTAAKSIKRRLRMFDYLRRNINSLEVDKAEYDKTRASLKFLQRTGADFSVL